MSVSKSPFRAGSGSVAAAPVSAGGAASKSVTNEELQDVLSATFLGKETWTELRAFLKATHADDALPAANFRKIVAFAVKHIEQGSLPEETRVQVADDAAILLYFTFALAVLSAALAQHTKDTTFTSDLTKLQIKADYVNELSNAYKLRSAHRWQRAGRSRWRRVHGVHECASYQRHGDAACAFATLCTHALYPPHSCSRTSPLSNTLLTDCAAAVGAVCAQA